MQTSFLGLSQKQNFNLYYAASWPLRVEVWNGVSITVLLTILYYFITGIIMYISEHFTSNKA